MWWFQPLFSIASDRLAAGFHFDVIIDETVRRMRSREAFKVILTM